MFDPEQFLERVASEAYPGPNNKWVYRVRDQFGYYTDPKNDEYVMDKNYRTLTQNPYLTLVSWRISGAETTDEIDSNKLLTVIEIVVSATSIRALNAFQYILNNEVQYYNQLTLNTFGDTIDTDERIGNHPQTTGRFYRILYLRVDDLIIGSEPLYEEN